MEEDLTEIRDSGMRYIIQLNKDGSTKEVREVNDEYELKENEYESNFKAYKEDQEKKLKKIFEKAVEKEKTIEKIKQMNLPITNYYDNAKKFYDIQPYFYDKTGLFWFWQEKESKYAQVDEIDVMISFDDVLGFNGQTVNSKVKTSTIEAMKRLGRKRIPKEAPQKWIQFKNKAYSISSGKIYNITPDYFFTNPIPWEIGVSDATPTMDKLFKEWVGEKYVKTLYQIIAYCCLTSYPIHLIFCLVGCGRNGKSKFQGLLNRFIGNDNICSTELDTLLDSRFESFKLYKKLLCSMGETNFGIMSKTSLLKKLTGQDLIGFEFKNKKPFDDYNYAKIIISSNSLPSSTDTSEGFYRRWLIIDFPNIFPEGKDILKTIPEEEYNNLANKVCKIMKELLEEGKFYNQGSIEERKNKYIFSSNPLSFFINLTCDKGYNLYMRYGELYIAYRKYLSKHKKRAINYKEFNDILALEGLEVQKTSKKIGDEWVNGKFILGVELKAKWIDLIDSCDSYASCDHTLPQLSHMGNEGGISAQASQASQEKFKGDKPYTQIIYENCHICGRNPSHFFDDSAQGKPICQDCKAYKDQNKGEAVND
jgi:P4 family phage/plasmid primase-like protien